MVEPEAPVAKRFAALAGDSGRLQTLADIRPRETSRVPTGIDEFDRVLGGGLVPGGVVLIGGDPGIGKSTLLLQALALLSGRLKALYVSGEESAEQVALRASRLRGTGVPFGVRRGVVASRSAETTGQLPVQTAEREAVPVFRGMRRWRA